MWPALASGLGGEAAKAAGGAGDEDDFPGHDNVACIRLGALSARCDWGSARLTSDDAAVRAQDLAVDPGAVRSGEDGTT